MTVENCIAEFLIEQQIRGNSKKTVEYYTRCLGFFSKFIDNTQFNITDISISDCKKYYLYLNQKDLTTTSIQTYIRALRSFLTWCYSESYIDRNIPDKFKLPKAQRKTIDVLTDTEIQQIFDCFKGKSFLDVRNYCIVALMLDSGLRLNEVVTLESGNIHIAEGYAVVNGKGNKQRIVPLGLNSKKALLRYTSIIPLHCDKTPLFVKYTLTTIKQSTVKDLFRKLKIQSNIPRLRPHLLRHTFATRYLENGGDIYSLQMILGHTSLEMVKKYVHLTTSKIAVNYTIYSPLDNVLKK